VQLDPDECLSVDRYVTGEPLETDGDFIGVIASLM